MVIPLSDNAELRFVRRPVVTWALIFLNVAVFLLVRSGFSAIL